MVLIYLSIILLIVIGTILGLSQASRIVLTNPQAYFLVALEALCTIYLLVQILIII